MEGPVERPPITSLSAHTCSAPQGKRESKPLLAELCEPIEASWGHQVLSDSNASLVVLGSPLDPGAEPQVRPRGQSASTSCSCLMASFENAPNQVWIVGGSRFEAASARAGSTSFLHFCITCINAGSSDCRCFAKSMVGKSPAKCALYESQKGKDPGRWTTCATSMPSLASHLFSLSDDLLRMVGIVHGIVSHFTVARTNRPWPSPTPA